VLANATVNKIKSLSANVRTLLPGSTGGGGTVQLLCLAGRHETTTCNFWTFVSKAKSSAAPRARLLVA
jgi:hypothetical protein